MKCSAVNVDFNGVRFDPLGSRSPLYECIKFGCPLQNAQFLPLSSSLARERLQINTDLLLIITNTADEVSHRWPWTTLNPRIGVFNEFFRDWRRPHTFSRVNCVEITGDGPRQPANENFSIKRRFQRCKVWPPRFKESSVRAHQIWVPPWKRAISTTVD